jgi:hypothetical protein
MEVTWGDRSVGLAALPHNPVSAREKLCSFLLATPPRLWLCYTKDAASRP